MTTRSTEELIAEARLHAEQVNRFGKVDGKPCLYDLLADRLTELSTPVGGDVREAPNVEAIYNLVASLKSRADSCAKRAKKKSGGDRCEVEGKGFAYAHAAKLIAKATLSTPASGRVPDGWKLVPIEPTDEMTRAATNKLDTPFYSDIEIAYREMVAAAPSPAEEGK